MKIIHHNAIGSRVEKLVDGVVIEVSTKVVADLP